MHSAGDGVSESINGSRALARCRIPFWDIICDGLAEVAGFSHNGLIAAKVVEKL